MFNRIKNIDILNQILVLDSKFDILNNKLNEKDKTLEGCCDCKLKEMQIYKEIKEYLEIKFLDFNNQVIEMNKNNKINEKIINSNNLLIKNFNKMFEEYREEVVNNLANIITTLSNYNKKDTSILNEKYIEKMDILYKLEHFEKEVLNKFSHFESNFNKLENNLNTKCENVLTNFQLLNTKIDNLYYENENIKHQLLLEDEIRKCSDEIDNLSLLIKTTINEM